MRFPPRRHSMLITAAAALVGALVAYFVLGDEARSEPPAEKAQKSETKAETSNKTEEPKEKPAPKLASKPSETDKGVFSDLDDKVRLHFPSWLKDRQITVVDPPGDGSLFAYVDGVPVGLAHEEMGEVTEVSGWGDNDADQDGIPNALDILIGAKKAALNGAKYQGGYKGMSYPGGDVPRTEGVCTDVLVRTVRNAGIDLQKELHEDIEAHRKAYPMVKTPDPNIDQRRVRTLLPYFKRHWQKLGTDPKEKGAVWAPGDVLFMDTMRDDRPEHMGIVSDRLGPSGLPLVINNWTNGYHTQEMDLLDFVPVTHRFRVPSEKLE